MEWIKYVALIICLVNVIIRIPGILQGKNVRAFWCFLLASLSIALTFDPIARWVDGILRVENISNLILRIMLYGLFYLISGIVARTYGTTPVGLRVDYLLRGKPGIWALGFACGATAVSFALGPFIPGTSTVADTLPGMIYLFTWRIYLAYVAALLLVMITPKIFDLSTTGPVRVSAVLQSLGYLMVVIYPVVSVLENMAGPTEGKFRSVESVLQFGSMILVGLGVTIGWLAGRVANQRRKNMASSG